MKNKRGHRLLYRTAAAAVQTLDTEIKKIIHGGKS